MERRGRDKGKRRIEEETLNMEEVEIETTEREVNETEGAETGGRGTAHLFTSSPFLHCSEKLHSDEL